MGNLISTCLFSSKANSHAQISDSSTWYPQHDQHISIRTFKELNPAPTSSPTSTKMGIPLSGANSRSTPDRLEAAAIMLMTHVPKH
uniref:AC4 protein n=1 Tax=East African cassava mosaic Zanzibar virus TaxID=223275 RepID=Q2A8H0_9GEMI|nr:AC4 protein [East African cassava mosaic Zanzibar virus]